jgi:hypothetical protein
LARMVSQPDSVIVDFDSNHFNTVIVSGGLPVILHSANTKNSSPNQEDIASQFVDELTRTIDFFNLTHKNNPIAVDTPILVSGDLDVNSESSVIIQKSSGYNLQPIKPSVSVPSGFPVSAYATNLGLILKNPQHSIISFKHGADFYFDININLLNGRKRTQYQAISLTRLKKPLAIALCVILIISFSLLHNQALSRTSKLQAELDLTNHTLMVERRSFDEANINLNAIKSLSTETASIQKARQFILGKSDIAFYLQYFLEALPSQAYFSDVLSSDSEVVLVGKMASRMDIINYARKLEKSGYFADVRVALIDTADENEAGLNFKIIIKY